MWILRNVNSGELLYLLRENSKYNIGRQGSDLVLRNDASISRNHAIMRFSATAGAEEVLTIEDAGSKYGTFHNDGISSNCKIDKLTTLKDGDKIRFGQLASVWCVTNIPLITMTSALSQKQTQQLGQQVAALSGRVIDRWDASCTHLTMDEVTVTVKLLHALLEQIPIVTCDYWRDLLETARSGRGALPLAEKYAPSGCEALMQKHNIDLNSRSERKHVFTGKTFVFMNRKHCEMYGPIVQKAGGAHKDMNSGVPKTFLLKKNVVVLQYIPSSESQSLPTIGSVTEYLESHSRRLIPEYEIGLAILHCSTEKYCNPNYKILDDILRLSPSKEVNAFPCTVLAEHSSTVSSQMNSELTDMLVKETNDQSEDIEASSSMNRAMLQDDNDCMPSLRVTESAQGESQGKRKHSSDEKAAAARNDNSSDSDAPVFQHVKRAHLEKQDTDKIGAAKTGRKGKFSPVAKTAKKALEEKSTSEESPKAIPPTKAAVEKTASKPSPKPLPITITTKRNVIATGGFLEKSQQPKARTSPDKSPSKKYMESEPGTRKRTRIAIITDEDDADDDLFSFEPTPSTSSHRAKKSRTNEIADDNDSDQELFGFTQRARDTVDVANDAADINDDPSTSNASSNNSNFMAMMPLPQPKPLPRKISTEGWLSTSLQDLKIKAEKVEKIEEDGAVLSDEQQWVRSLKGGFEVRTRAMNTVPHCKDASLEEPQTSNKFVEKTKMTNGRNFKAFVKKPNSNRPPKIITTVKVPVVNSRLR